MSKVGLIAFATALLLAGVIYANNKITLTCSGTLKAKDSNPPWTVVQVPNQSIVIDLDQGWVTSSFGGYSITKLTDSTINFEGHALNGDIGVGGLDRRSGVVVVSRKQNDEIISTYSLACK